MSKEKGIEISKKYGANPSIQKCFWCGEDKGVVLFGRIRNKNNKDAEAPKHVITDYELCDKCKEYVGDNLMVIEVTDIPNETTNVPVKGDGANEYYPTGRWLCLKGKSKVVENGKVLAHPELFEEIIKKAKENK